MHRSRWGVLWIIVASGTGWASSGTDYLASQTNADGSYSSDKATSYHATAEVVRTLRSLGQTSGVAISEGFLNARTHHDIKTLAPKIVANIDAGIPVPAFVAELLAAQNSDGGFSEELGGYSNALDTAFALEALAIAGQSQTQAVSNGLLYLTSQQQPDGSWTSGGEPSVYVTALAMRAVWLHRNAYPVSGAVSKAQSYLLSQRGAGGLWSETYLSAQALISILPTLVDRSPVQSSVDALRAQQLANGSFENDVYVTALSLRALALADAPATAPANPDLASIGARVIDGQTGQPLSGVSGVLTGAISRSLATAADGLVRFTELPAPGQYEVRFSLTSYNTVTTVTYANAGQVINFGTIQLVKNATATTGTAKGTVADSVTGEGLAGVLVSASTGQTTLTGASGSYQITNIPAGSVTLTTAKDGYSVARATATLSAGGLFVFSPSLTPASQNTNSIQGTVTASANNQPLAGVTIALSGATSLSTTTASDGRYRIDGLSPGVTTVTASKSGFDAVAVTFTAQDGSATDFSPNLYAQGSSPANANTSGVTGIAMDSVTNQPLGAVQIVLTQGTKTQTVTTGASGSFSASGYNPGTVGLSITRSGYVKVVYAIELPVAEIFNAGQIRLRPLKADYLNPDLIVTAVTTGASVVTDPQSLQVSGYLSASVQNIGTALAPAGTELLAFYDADQNGIFNEGTDIPAGRAVTAADLGVEQAAAVTIPLAGTLPFRDAPLSVFADSAGWVPELREENNVAASTASCAVKPSTTIDPVLKWEWTGSLVIPQHNHVVAAPIITPLIDTNGDGRTDQNDAPAIVFASWSPTTSNADGVLRAVDGRNGKEIWTVSDPNLRVAAFDSPAAADLDADGDIEIVAPTHTGLMAVDHLGRLLWKITIPTGSHWGAVTIADLEGDGVPEILYGRTVVNANGTVRWSLGKYWGSAHHIESPSETFGHPLSLAADLDLDGVQEVIIGPSARRANGTLVWENNAIEDGATAVADFDRDGFPEIVHTSAGPVSLVSRTGQKLWGPVQLGWNLTGPPIVVDVDKDGIPEIGVVSRGNFTLLRADGSIAWSRVTDDLNSGQTSASAFDFNGDGFPEIVYADAFTLWIFNGRTGEVIRALPHRNGTVQELPVIADVDGDDHADMVVAVNDPNSQNGPHGIRVFQNRDNGWANTRKIWNQHAYHVTNIEDSGRVPRPERPSWQANNSYRHNVVLPSSVADITASFIQILDLGAGQPLSVTVRIGNAGSKATPSNLEVALYDGSPQAGGPRIASRTVPSLLPGAYVDVRFDGLSGLSGADLYAVADWAGKVAECGETNNTHHVSFRTAIALGDIQVSTDAPAYGPDATAPLKATSTNTGAASNAYIVELQIEDAGGAVVERFGPYPLGTLSSGQTVPLTQGWSTGSTRSGGYVLRGILRRDDGSVVDDATTSFAIGASTGDKASLRTTTDRQSYHTTDRVQIGNLARNLTSNHAIPSAVLRLSVLGPAAQTVLSQDIPLGELAPNGLRERTLTQVLSAAAQGSYQVQGILLDSAGQTLATASAAYEVREDLTRSISGSVTAQKASLQQGESQTCTDTLSNRGTADATDLQVRQTVARLEIDQTLGQTVTGIELAAGTSQSLTRNVSTAAMDGGDYTCVLEAYANNQWVSLGYAVFTVTPEPTRISTTVTTDRAVYDVTDEVLITSPVQSLMQYRTVKNAIQHLDIAAPDGSVVFTQDLPLADLAPGAVLTTQVSYAFSDGQEGIYTVRHKVLDGGAIVASSDAAYQVKKSLAHALAGSVTVEKADVQQGDTQTCNDVVESSSIYALTGVQVRQRLRLSGQAEPISSTERTLTLTAQGSETLIRAFGTEALEQGDYACALDALIGGEWIGLGSAGFKVTPPPIRVDASLTLGGIGRVLVLLDANPPPSSIGQTEPASALQRSFIETLLTKAGWSYTIVTDKNAFAWELRSGDYSLYALFAESVKLDEPVQKELREAVYRCEGLLDAGSHDQRHHGFDDALGTKYIGKHSNVQGIDAFTTTLGSGNADITLKDKTLKAQLLNAVKLGRYIGVSSEDLAIATRDYGQGKSVYMGFDLLAEAALAGETSFHASLILQSLTHVQPSYAQVAGGQVVPLQITLTNRGIAVAGRALLPLPAGSVAVDRREATVQSNTLTWTYSLNEGEEKVFTAWVRLPAQAGTLDLTANVQIGSAPNYTDHTTATLNLNLQLRAGLAEARALAASNIAFKKVQLWLDKADAALSVNKPDVALGDLVQGADEAMKVAHPQAAALRLMIDQALMETGRTLWER